ncbi:lyase [Streptomyces sp. MUM 203J]|uniref:terpene synthase family protein n=1 Tax=Streptomyces sp. MUM 203J TaxID=2791990 RepID=UPI001F04532A|nr:terpene synthase family protein [Streptomyces sp. MUM 203J]MCH0543091.1 lyase [Streptomyces sp. MUM 203J]
MPQLDSFIIPEFHLPFENCKDPGAERANAEATAWSVERGLIDEATEEFAGIGFGHLAARVSNGASYDDLVLLAQWMAWSFVLDDQHDLLIRDDDVDDWRPVAAAITGYVADGRADRIPKAARNPLVDSFVELCDRILDRMPPGIQGRYRVHVPLMLRSLDEEAANRRPGYLPPVGDYILTRRHSSQLLPMMDMVEAALGIDVPPPVHASPAVQELAWSAIDVISWGNDVFSLPKEYSCGDTNNLAALLAAWQGWALPQAVRAVEERIEARVEDFLAGARALPAVLDALGVADPTARKAAELRVRAYEDWMVGSDLWQRYDCTRYRDERFAAGLEAAYTRPGLVTAV